MASQGGEVKLEFDVQKNVKIKCVILKLVKLEMAQRVCSHIVLHITSLISVQNGSQQERHFGASKSVRRMC